MGKAVSSYLACLASGKGVVGILDGWHWMGPASVNLFSNVVALVHEKPLLFIGLLRPDREAASWGFMEQVRTGIPGSFHEISLEPVPGEETNILVNNLLGITELEAGTVHLILEKAEGNPFFVEEVIRSLIETKQLVFEQGHWRVSGEIKTISMPSTLTGVLGTRIDRLSEEPRRILQIASVIGRSFERDILVRLTESESSSTVDAHLQKLEQAGLIHEVRAPSESGFMFRHALVQDAAYGSILLKQRRALHTRTGIILEERHADRIEELAPLLAHHFYYGEDSRSIQYDTLAGDSATRLFANAEAAVHFGRALEVARKSDTPRERIAELYSKYGGALEQSGHYEQALENYTQMKAYARETGDLGLEFSALMALATVYSIFTAIHNPVMAEKTMIEALELAKQIGDPDAQIKLHWNLMLTYSHSQRLPQAEAQGEIALGLASESKNRELLAFVLNDLTRIYTVRGKFEKAYNTIRRARQLWRELDNQSMLADSLGAEAEARYGAGELDQMIQLLREGLGINEKTNNLWGQSYDRILLHFAYFDRAEADLAIEMATSGIELGDQSGLIASSISVRCDLAWAYGCYGAIDQGLALVQRGLEIAGEKQPDWLAIPRSIMIRLLLLRGTVAEARSFAGSDLLQPVAIPYPHYTVLVCMAHIDLALAEKDLRKALELADALLRELSPLAKTCELEVMYTRAKVLVAMGRLPEAHAILDDARTRASSLGTKQILLPILILQAKVETQLGQQDQSTALLGLAREIAIGIADRLENSGIRPSFLSLPEARALTA